MLIQSTARSAADRQCLDVVHFWALMGKHVAAGTGQKARRTGRCIANAMLGKWMTSARYPLQKVTVYAQGGPSIVFDGKLQWQTHDCVRSATGRADVPAGPALQFHISRTIATVDTTQDSWVAILFSSCASTITTMDCSGRTTLARCLALANIVSP